MNPIQRLNEIWSAPYMQTLPAQVKERGYGINKEITAKDILIIGMNPAYHENEQGSQLWDYNFALQNNTDSYFSLIRKMLKNETIDLCPQATISDLFYFRETNQDYLQKHLLNSIQFVVDQVNLTMHIIEDIVRPKLIIIKNKEASAYFGKLYQEKGWVWMGYQFQHIIDTPCGELCRIVGLIDSNQRIAPEFKQTNIHGSYMLFTKHLQFMKAEERPTPQFLQDILTCRDAELNILKYASL